jgi:hypothetical protein
MSRWGIVTASLVALVFLTLPLLMAQVNRSGRMARWDERAGRWASKGWTPPWWYSVAVASSFVTGGLVVWLMEHDVLLTCLVVVQGALLTINAVVAWRQARGS